MREAIRSKYKIENGENDKRNRFKKQFKTCILGPIYFSVSLNIYNKGLIGLLRLNINEKRNKVSSKKNQPE